MKLYDYLLKEYGTTNPIFIKDLNIEGMNKEAIRMRISRLVKAGKLRRQSAGVYYIPEMINELNIEKSLSVNVICQKKYIEDENGEIIGFYTGLYLLNKLGFMTQVPNVLEIVTNKEKRRVREVKIGDFTRILRRPYIQITTANEKYLQLLDLLRILNDEDYNNDKSKNFKNIKYLISKRKINLNEAINFLYVYPKKVERRFMEIKNEFTR